MASSTLVNPKAAVQQLTMDNDSLKFPAPFTMSINGPSQSGKSSFVCKLIENRRDLFNVNFDRIIFCQQEHLILRPNEIFERLRLSFPQMELVAGLPDIKRLQLDIDPSSHKLVIIDDMQCEFLESKEMYQLLSVDCHHSLISTIYCLQNYFAASKFKKSISRNTHFKVLFYNRCDLTELRHISMQIQPNNATFLQSCFNFLSKTFPGDFHYIVIDGHFRSPTPQFVVKSLIFPKENGKIEPIIFFSSV